MLVSQNGYVEIAHALIEKEVDFETRDMYFVDVNCTVKDGLHS